MGHASQHRGSAHPILVSAPDPLDLAVFAASFLLPSLSALHITRRLFRLSSTRHRFQVHTPVLRPRRAPSNWYSSHAVFQAAQLERDRLGNRRLTVPVAWHGHTFQTSRA